MEKREQKQILNKLIPYYTNCIAEMQGLIFSECEVYISEKNILCGICWAAQKQFDICLYDEEWVKPYIPQDENYWFDKPYRQSTKDDMIKCLVLRLDLMKSILQNLK